jgi:hypothetical protein
LDIEVFCVFVREVQKYSLKFVHGLVPALADSMLGGGECAGIRCERTGVLTEDVAGNLISQDDEGEQRFRRFKPMIKLPCISFLPVWLKLAAGVIEFWSALEPNITALIGFFPEPECMDIARFSHYAHLK